MTTEQCLMIILTVVIAVSAVCQAIFIREQSELLRRAEALRTEVTTAVTVFSHSHVSAGADVETTRFLGLQIVNHSMFPITISGWHFDVEQPPSERAREQNPADLRSSCTATARCRALSKAPRYG